MLNSFYSKGNAITKGERRMNNESKSSVVYQGKIPGRVKYTFAFGALGKDLIYGMIATFSMIYFTDIIKVAQF